MGKSTKYPSYSTGTISVNGNTKANTYQNSNNIITNYNMSDAEKQAYEYAQNSFAQNLPYINIFDENTKKGLQSQLDAYTQKGQKMIDSIYNPMLNSLKNDIASRFGNFDNSVFMDNLNSIEANRAQSVNDLAQDILAKESDLTNNELSNRYNYLNFLLDIQNSTNSNILNFANLSQTNSSSGNSYNAQAYEANKSAQDDYINLASGILNTMGTYGQATTAALKIAQHYNKL